MKEKKNDFLKKYNLLFEKPRLRILEEKKAKKLALLGVIAIGLAAASPYLAAIVAFNVTNGVVKNSQNELDRIKESQDFVEVPIFKENLSVRYPPNYNKVKEYQLSFHDGTINFGNGYTLKIKDFDSIEEKISGYSLKPTKGYDSAEGILQVKTSITEFPIVNDGKKHMYDKSSSFESVRFSAVRVTGNLIKSVDMQRTKEKDGFLTLFEQPDIGEVKTGIVVNSKPSQGLSDDLGEIPNSYVVLTKYWLFPDGVGVLVDVDGAYLGNLSKIADFSKLSDSKLKKIDKFTNNTYSWLSDHFEMVVTNN